MLRLIFSCMEAGGGGCLNRGGHLFNFLKHSTVSKKAIIIIPCSGEGKDYLVWRLECVITLR